MGRQVSMLLQLLVSLFNNVCIKFAVFVSKGFFRLIPTKYSESSYYYKYKVFLFETKIIVMKKDTYYFTMINQFRRKK